MKTFKVIGLLLLVFVAGFSGGMVAARIMVHHMVADAAAHPEKTRKNVEQSVESNLYRRLRLDAGQREKVHQILKNSRDRTRAIREEFQPKFNAIVIETRTNIAAVLSPEQNARFEEFLADNRQFLPYRELPPLPKKAGNNSMGAMPRATHKQ
ncbi:MAG TPA: hypothetical protein VN761_12315 [Candidatus Polarisedimenticolia bacterium]|nr:hypothetical protein [Candidatus Polarisedimenticolia bacterium]